MLTSAPCQLVSFLPVVFRPESEGMLIPKKTRVSQPGKYSFRLEGATLARKSSNPTETLAGYPICVTFQLTRNPTQTKLIGDTLDTIFGRHGEEVGVLGETRNVHEVPHL